MINLATRVWGIGGQIEEVAGLIAGSRCESDLACKMEMAVNRITVLEKLAHGHGYGLTNEECFAVCCIAAMGWWPNQVGDSNDHSWHNRAYYSAGMSHIIPSELFGLLAGYYDAVHGNDKNVSCHNYHTCTDAIMSLARAINTYAGIMKERQPQNDAPAQSDK